LDQIITAEINQSKENIATDALINKAVVKAIKEYNRQQVSEKKRKALHNTKMLLKNYNKIKISIEEAISEADQLEQDTIYCTDDEEVYINSIRKSKLRSLIVIAHIDKALAIIKEEYKNKGTSEKYDAFMDCMIYGMTYDEAAVIYFTSKQSISRWVVDTSKLISIQLFGVDGLELI
jgi:HD superfamily phosphohydrolase